MIPTDVAGIGIEIADSHILPFTVKEPEEVMQMLHNYNDENPNASSLYNQNQPKTIKFVYTCAEIFYRGYHQDQLKNGKLGESKVRALTQQESSFFLFIRILFLYK